MANREMLKKIDDCVRVLKDMHIELVNKLPEDKLRKLHALLLAPQNGPVRNVIEHDFRLLIENILSHNYPSMYDPEERYAGHA